MKPSPDPLDRLFRAAARAPREIVPPASFAFEAGVLAALHRPPGDTDEWFAFLPLFRAGLAVAACLALIALAASWRPDSPSESDESAFLVTPAIELTYLP